MIRTPDPADLVRIHIRPRLAFLLDAPREKLIKALVVACVAAAAYVLLTSRFGLFLDVAEPRCLPGRLYVGFPRSEQIHKGDIVSFRVNNKMMLGLMTGARVGKLVVGVPGDHVVSNASGVTVNGVFVAPRNASSMAKMAEHGKVAVDVDKVLEPGELFVMGTLPRSFDSRYWGVLRDEAVDRQLKEIL